MKSFRYRFLSSLSVFVLAAVFFIPAGEVSSQAFSGVSMSVSPESPKPGDKVTAKLTSFEMDLSRALIYWTLNGKAVSSGRGKDSYFFIAGKTGVAARVSATVQLNGSVFTSSKTIVPADIDVLWQATDSYTPPFYRGKALPAEEASIRVVAVPNMISGGTQIKPSSLVYSWSRNGKMVSAASGYGKNYYDFKNNYLDIKENVSVDVSSMNNSLSGKSSVSIGFHSPRVLIYENNPLRGIVYEKALGILNMKNNEIRITAEPYFISIKDRHDISASYSWILNGKTVVGAPDDQSSLVLRNEGGSGTARVGISVNQNKKMFQSGDGTFTVNFGK